MKKRNYKSFIIVITYLMLLRVVLDITTGISFFNFGMLFDLLLTMFWIGFFSNLIRHKTSQKVYYIFIILFSSALIIGDVIYFEYFNILTSKSNLMGIGRLTEGNTTEYNLSIPYVVYLITPLMLIASYFIIANKELDVFRIRDFGIVSLVLVLQIGLFLTWGSYNFDNNNEHYKSDAYLFETMYDRSLFSEKYGYYTYHVLDFVDFKPDVDEEKVYEEINVYFSERTSHVTNDFSDDYSGYNVITIVGETLETRFIDPILTPNLYLMKTEGYSFDNFYTTVFQQGATCNTEFMGFTGLSAMASHDWVNNVCDSYSENTYTYALPNQLNSIGYNTYYFHSGYEWFYNRDVISLQYGFETVKFQEDLYDLGYDDFYDRYDTEMLYFFDEFVNYDELFYINLLTYSMHGAYNQEEFFKYNDRVEEAYPGVDIDSEIVNYMEKLVEFDNMLGLIIDDLDSHGQLDNTLFVIYPDHYPYMMDRDVYSDYIDIDFDSHEIMRQDLIIYATDMTGEVISMTGSTIDIAPTILNLVDSSLNFDYFMGIDLLSDTSNYVLFSDLTITDGFNYLFLNGYYIGDSSKQDILEIELTAKISQLELQKKLLIIDYFKKLKENE